MELGIADSALFVDEAKELTPLELEPSHSPYVQACL